MRAKVRTEKKGCHKGSYTTFNIVKETEKIQGKERKYPKNLVNDSKGQQKVGLFGASGVLSSVLHRDDFAQRGLSAGAQTLLPFDVNGADVLVLDDVLYTGRTLRAVLNELFDYGRPASVRLAVLVDRGGRELPVQA